MLLCVREYTKHGCLIVNRRVWSDVCKVTLIRLYNHANHIVSIHLANSIEDTTSTLCSSYAFMEATTSTTLRKRMPYLGDLPIYQSNISHYFGCTLGDCQHCSDIHRYVCHPRDSSDWDVRNKNVDCHILSL